jgi:hypothetical protein
VQWSATARVGGSTGLTGRRAERDPFGHAPFVIPELAEAAARTGDFKLVEAVQSWMSMLTEATPTDWALGIEARVQALAGSGKAAERLYRESFARLSRTRLRAELARSHLLYGEWLRRERRRTDAREQLRTALDMLEAMGIEAFADRARRELAAPGETARERSADSSDQLTVQETQVTRLAVAGLRPLAGVKSVLGADIPVEPGCCLATCHRDCVTGGRTAS